MPIVVLKVKLAVGHSEMIPDVRHTIAWDWTELIHIAAMWNIVPIVVLKVELAVGHSEMIPDVHHIIAWDWTELTHIAAHEGTTKLIPQPVQWQQEMHRLLRWRNSCTRNIPNM